MAYNPQSENEFRDEYGRGRYEADNRRHRHTGPRADNQTNDFHDTEYRQPNSRGADQGYPDRRDDRRFDQEFGRSSRPGSYVNDGRRQGATGYGYGDVGREYGQGRAGFNGDEDRGYDQNGLRGGLGNSGGRDDFADRRFDQDRNAFRGGYGGGDYDRGQRDEPLLGRIGMNSRGPQDPRRDQDRRYDEPRNDNRRRDNHDYGRGWNDMDDRHGGGQRR
ncbi:hypothetical protein [Hymenobacter sp. CRA2]|uniref:hypothetical protein n=1 Tax=Hymenobacter sp. CRA2 TaxID=1955620 RepID=UPI000990213E|nr:hypothetical protein [Hymenobacter sp. CRA2]OON68890.1 hypothetical protein B0919_12035 [Hymenobacter sp. CRA2]